MFVKSLAAAGGACAVICGCALAQAPQGRSPGRPLAPAVASYDARPVVVEMFLSQSCKSSPPAAAFLAELAGRPDVVALGWHVDYWDKFAAQDVGAWTDPYARAAFAQRQKAYNARIRGRAMMFTPQAVIDGIISVVGSKRETVEARILEAQFYDEKAHATPPLLTIDEEGQEEGQEEGGSDMLRARIDGVGAPYDALVVSFRRLAVTPIDAGDNAGVTFHEANVVKTVATLASAHEGPGDFSFRAPGEGFDCAVLVQERNQGRIVAARYCADAPPLN